MCTIPDAIEKAEKESVERGYCYEVNESCEDSKFRFEFKAVTGDTETPVLLFDVYVEEEELTNSYDELELSVDLLRVTFSCGGNKYTLTRTLYGQYEAEFYFEGDIPSGNVVVEAGREEQRDNDFQPQWSEFISELTLEVDGTEYRITDENYLVLEEAGNKYTGCGI